MFCTGTVALLYLLVLNINITSCADLPDNAERNLIDTLLTDYDVNARPTTDPRLAVMVHVYFALVGIVEIDEESQTITSTGEVMFVWNDAYLSWNETNYEGVKALALDKSRVWLPDAAILNRNGGDSIMNDYKEKVKVSSDGQLTWSTHGTYVTACSIAMTTFPFDRHACAINIGPDVSTSQQQIVLPMKKNRTSSFEQNSAWSLLTNSWSCSDSGQSDLTPYSTCTLLFTITRRGDRQYIISAIPLVVLSIMSCFVFILSAKTIEKMTFILVVFATYAFVLVFVQESFPAQLHGYSYLSVYFVIEFGIIGLMSTVAIFTVNITCKDDLSIPPCLKCLARVVTCKLKKHVNVISSERTDIIRAPGADMAYKTRTGKFSDSSGSEYVCEITWIDVASGLDRLFFILFLVVNIISPIVVFNIIKS